MKYNFRKYEIYHILIKLKINNKINIIYIILKFNIIILLIYSL